MISRVAVISRIKKLLARANGTDNIHESTSARRMARELASAHDIDESETKESRDGEAVLEGSRFGDGWRMHLVRAICRPLGLQISRKRRRRSFEVAIKGKLDDASMAHAAYLFLEQAIDKLKAPPALAGYQSSYADQEELITILASDGNQWEYDFRLGVAESVGMRWKGEIIKQRGSKPATVPMSRERDRGPVNGGLIMVTPPVSKTAFQLGVEAGNHIPMPPEEPKKRKKRAQKLLPAS